MSRQTEQNTEKIRKWQDRVNAFGLAISMIDIDVNEGAPSQGASYRNKARTYLATQMRAAAADPEMTSVFEEVLSDPDADADNKRIAALALRKVKQNSAVSADAYTSYQEALTAAEQAWMEARRNNGKETDAHSYKRFAPYLEKLVAALREMYEPAAQQAGVSVFDYVLDLQQPGWNSARYDALFEMLTERIVPLIREIGGDPARHPSAPENAFLHQYYPAEIQRAFMQEILSYIGFTSDWGKMGESAHALTTFLSRGDLRFTTKYREHDIPQAVFSTVHEGGHAWYWHNIDPAYDGTLIAQTISAGMSESQSRLCENHLGRSLPFWEANLPVLKKYFPEQLAEVDAEKFYRAINAAGPSLIRTDADELTYPIHIMIRYEIEKGMLNGTLQVSDLDEVWNSMYEQNLGIRPSNDGEGILQDMHWPYGYFGYFPTYVLGSAWAAQFNAAMRSELDVDRLLRENKYPQIMKWLGEKIHRYGNLYEADEILRCVTGEDFNPAYYCDYLEQKYRSL